MSQDEDTFLDANQEDSDYDGGDIETFTFSGGAIDIDEIFGGIDTDLILDGGGSAIVKYKSDGTREGYFDTVDGETSKGVMQYYQSEDDVKKSNIIETDSETKESDLIETDSETKKSDIIETKPGDDEDKKPDIIVAEGEDDKRSFNGGDDDDVVHGGGGHTTVCSKIVELLPNLFTPVHDL
jgi:hypothetical protein